MKNLFLLVAFVVIGSSPLLAQERDQDRIQDQDRTKLVMIDGAMLEVRERAQIRLQDKQTLNDGTVVSPNGSFLTKNGNRLRLKDGECLDMDGIKYRNEYQYRYKIQQENKGLTQPQIQERNQNRVHYMLVDGEVMQVRTKSQNRLQNRLELADGAYINSNGMYQTKDRKQLRLLDGECLNMDGEMFKNTYQHRKMILQKNMMKNKMQTKPKIQKKKKIG